MFFSQEKSSVLIPARVNDLCFGTGFTSQPRSGVGGPSVKCVCPGRHTAPSLKLMPVHWGGVLKKKKSYLH